jgi:hypothetical protein
MYDMNLGDFYFKEKRRGRKTREKNTEILHIDPSPVQNLN